MLLSGASGAAALLFARDSILGPSEASLVGIECEDVLRVAVDTHGGRPWLRKFIKTESADGLTRVKTALRVATLLHDTLPSDVVHIAVLDENGPEKRADMRGRAIGAEVVILRDPTIIPDNDGEFIIRYYEGYASPDGIFYGRQHVVSSAEARAFVARMGAIEKEDCLPPGGEVAVEDSGGHGSKASSGGHGEAAPSEHGEATSDAHASSGHGEEPTDGHGAAAGGHGDESETGGEPGFFGKMLNMVGLGADEVEGGPDAANVEHADADAVHDVTSHADLAHPVIGHEADADGNAHVMPAPLRVPQDAFSAPLGADNGHSVADAFAQDATGHEGDHDVASGHGAESAHEAPAESAMIHADARVEDVVSQHTDIHNADEAPQTHEANNAHSASDGHADAIPEAQKAEPGPVVADAWDGGQNGELFLVDGPSDELMLNWEGDESAETVGLDPAPVSSVEDGQGAAHE